MSETANFNGKMIVFTAPSGSGKTTIVKHLLANFDFLSFSVSATTRPKREYETDKKDYYFLSAQEFKKTVENDLFLEWEEVYTDQFYGTLKSELDRVWSLQKHIVFDIDVMGAINLKKQYPDQCLAIFVRPPSLEILTQRLKDRNTESKESLQKRINKASFEMQYENIFDFTLVNDELSVAFMEAENLVQTFCFGI